MSATLFKSVKSVSRLDVEWENKSFKHIETGFTFFLKLAGLIKINRS